MKLPSWFKAVSPFLPFGRTVKWNGINILAKPARGNLEQELFLFGKYAPHIAHQIMTLKAGDTFIDVGANIGLFSLMAAKKGVRVIAYEPMKESADTLARHASLNQCAVDLRTYGLSSMSGLLKFDSREHEWGMSRVAENGDMEIEVRTLDEEEIDKVTLIKIDVEGHELQVLRGAEKTIKRCSPSIIHELSPSIIGKGHCVEQLAFLKSLGYEHYNLDKERTGQTHLISDIETFIEKIGGKSKDILSTPPVKTT